MTTHKILPLDIASSNNRIYPTEVVAAAIRDLQQLPVTYGYRNDALEIQPATIATDFSIDDSHLCCKFKTDIQIDTKSLKFVIRPAGTGIIEDDGRISDFKLQYLAIIPADTDSFKK